MSTCMVCGAQFACGMAEGSASGEPCWCTTLPALPQEAYLPCKDAAPDSRCLCPACLRARLNQAGSRTAKPSV